MPQQTDTPVSFLKNKIKKCSFGNKTNSKVELLPFHYRDDVTVVQQKSHKESLNSHLDRLNLWFELRSLFYGDRGSDNGA